MARILLVDDARESRRELARLLTDGGYEVEEAGGGAQAVSLGPQSFDLVACHLRGSGDGTGELVARCHPTPVLILKTYASVRSAVEAMKLGAVDYVASPPDRDELLLSIERILREKRLERRVDALQSTVDRQWPSEPLTGESEPMREVLRRVRRVAPTRATVLVVGESGTGKELVARAIHAQSDRRDAPFVAVNCAAIPESLFESELFGHEKGAFTGATAAREGLVKAADGGTLFLDEVGELPLAAQARLLRLLQQSELRRLGSSRLQRVDTRLIAATHRDLPRMISLGRFREDFYFRLRVIQIRVPPLRDRLEDLPSLADALVARACHRLGQPQAQLSAAAHRELATYPWPGNVRELQNAIERALILHGGRVLDAASLGLSELRREAALAKGESPTLDGDASIEGYFRRFVLAHQARLSEKELAERLGVSRKALWERRRRLGIARPKRAARPADPVG